MSESTDVARGAINGVDELSVQLIQPDHMPAVVRIVWPPQPTVCDTGRFPDTAALLTRLFATAATELARIKARRG
jgi:hypothetical protein